VKPSVGLLGRLLRHSIVVVPDGDERGLGYLRRQPGVAEMLGAIVGANCCRGDDRGAARARKTLRPVLAATLKGSCRPPCQSDLRAHSTIAVPDIDGTGASNPTSMASSVGLNGTRSPHVVSVGSPQRSAAGAA
jgi:hypothetical protein